MSFRFPTVADFAAAYRKGTTDPAQVIERALTSARTLDRMDPPMHTFIALDEGDVRRQAEASVRRWQKGAPLSPFDGVPVAVKDEYDVAGYATTRGTKFLGGRRPRATRSRWRGCAAAGAIIFGKTNMHELGMQPSGINPWHGTARNPYDPERDTGGSSSGSGACVGMGLVPVALGTDGWRLDPHPGGAQRCRRPQGHLRARAARRGAASVLVARAHRTARGDGGRHAAGARASSPTRR